MADKQIWTVGAIIEATEELAERARRDVHEAVESFDLAMPPRLRPVTDEEDREFWQQDLSEGRRLTEGEDAEVRPVWHLEFVVEGTEEDGDRAKDAVAYALCPDEFHSGPCEVPWTLMMYAGEPEVPG